MASLKITKFPSTKKNLNVNRDYLKNEIFKSLKSAKRNETNNNKQSKKQLYGNSLIQTRNFQKGKNDVYLNSTTNPNVDNLSKQSGVTSTTNRYNSLMLNLFNTRNDSKEKNWVNVSSTYIPMKNEVATKLNKTSNTQYNDTNTNNNTNNNTHSVTNKKAFKPEFQVNKKLYNFLEKEKKDNIKYSLFTFPEYKRDNKAYSLIPYEYFNDFLETFCTEEQTVEFKIKPNYMDGQKEINNKMRAIVVNWIIEVHNRFKLLPDTLFLAIVIFDRYMSLVKSIEKKRLQLIGVTSLLLACKYEEIFSPEIRDFVCILDRAYEREDLMDEENQMMKLLKFEVTYPTSLKYFEVLRMQLGISDEYYNIGCLFLELVLLDSMFSKYTQAVIASSVCYMCLKFMGDSLENFWKNVKMNSEDVKNCVLDICFILDNVENSEYPAVVKKRKEEIKKVHELLGF